MNGGISNKPARNTVLKNICNKNTHGQTTLTHQLIGRHTARPSQKFQGRNTSLSSSFATDGYRTPFESKNTELQTIHVHYATTRIQTTISYCAQNDSSGARNSSHNYTSIYSHTKQKTGYDLSSYAMWRHGSSSTHQFTGVNKTKLDGHNFSEDIYHRNGKYAKKIITEHLPHQTPNKQERDGQCH